MSAGSASTIVIAPSATARRQGQSAGASATAASTIAPTLSTLRSAATATAAGIILRPLRGARVERDQRQERRSGELLDPTPLGVAVQQSRLGAERGHPGTSER